MKTLIAACLLASLLISCAPAVTRYKNPINEAAANPGLYAEVLIRDDTNLALYPAAKGIGIEVIIDGELAAKLNWDQQVKILIKKGRHDLVLTHRDLFKFTDSYEINLVDDNYLLDVFCRPLSTGFEIKPVIVENAPEERQKPRAYTTRIQRIPEK